MGTGFHLDEQLTDREHKGFFNPSTKSGAVLPGYRCERLVYNFKNVRSDYHILVGSENRDPHFIDTLKQFKQAPQQYKQEGYFLDTAGHNL